VGDTSPRSLDTLSRHGGVPKLRPRADGPAVTVYTRYTGSTVSTTERIRHLDVPPIVLHGVLKFYKSTIVRRRTSSFFLVLLSPSALRSRKFEILRHFSSIRNRRSPLPVTHHVRGRWRETHWPRIDELLRYPMAGPKGSETTRYLVPPVDGGTSANKHEREWLEIGTRPI